MGGGAIVQPGYDVVMRRAADRVVTLIENLPSVRDASAVKIQNVRKSVAALLIAVRAGSTDLSPRALAHFRSLRLTSDQYVAVCVYLDLVLFNLDVGQETRHSFAINAALWEPSLCGTGHRQPPGGPRLS